MPLRCLILFRTGTCWPATQNELVQVGKYQVGKTIGEGTFGKVKLAVNTETGEKMAIKVRRVCYWLLWLAVFLQLASTGSDGARTNVRPKGDGGRSAGKTKKRQRVLIIDSERRPET